MRKQTSWALLFCAALSGCLAQLDDRPSAATGGRVAQGNGVAIKGGTLEVGGRRMFLKTAVPLMDFALDDARDTIDVLLAKQYNNIKINLYWEHFDTNGDGVIDKSLGKLNQLIAHIEAKQAFWSLSFGTYNVGGGGVPAAFFSTHPDAQAMNSLGQKAIDTEYGTGKPVPSIFHQAYLQASREFIRNAIHGLTSKNALYFETTVEPQYIGNQALDYSSAAQAAYKGYCATKGLPFAWPPAEGNAQWNTFRARALADWIQGDIQAIRSEAGASALVAVDYLETGGPEMTRRNGGSATLLGALTGVNIIQCNWHWYPGTNTPFDGAYDLANSLAVTKGWAISEHMTLVGDLGAVDPGAVLQHTLSKGNRFGWEVVNTRPNTHDPFTTYNSDWSPKPAVAPLDQNHAYWMSMGYGGKGAPYAGTYVAQQCPAEMVSGSKHTVWVDLLNIGAAAWNANTRLGTTGPQDRNSAFFTPGAWLGPSRPAAAPSTPTGGVARFLFTMTAPNVSTPTVLVERWGLVQEAVQWFTTPPQSEIWFQITVHPQSSPTPPADPTALCTVVGGGGTSLFSGTLTKSSCVAKCQAYATTKPNRTCKWGSDTIYSPPKVVLACYQSTTYQDRWCAAGSPPNSTYTLQSANQWQIAGNAASDTYPLYNCRSPYSNDHMVSASCGVEGYTTVGLIGDMWKNTAPGRVPIYRCWTPGGDHFLTSSSSCEYQNADGLVGYAIPIGSSPSPSSPPPPGSSCSGRCGTKSSDGTCWCDSLCTKYGDCCKDKTQHC